MLSRFDGAFFVAVLFDYASCSIRSFPLLELKRGLKDNTFQNYQYMYRQFVYTNLGKMKITQIRRSDVRRFYNLLADERNLKISTVEEQNLFTGFLENHRQYNHWKPIFDVMLGTGLRVGEVTGLRWEDIDLDKRTISVNHTLVYYNHKDNSCYFNINTPKTKAGNRVVYMTAQVKEAFEQEKKNQELLGMVQRWDILRKIVNGALLQMLEKLVHYKNNHLYL